MELDIFKIIGFIILILVYLIIRKFFKKLADFTESIGKSIYNEDEIKRLNTKIITLEQKINNKP